MTGQWFANARTRGSNVAKLRGIFVESDHWLLCFAKGKLRRPQSSSGPKREGNPLSYFRFARQKELTLKYRNSSIMAT